MKKIDQVRDDLEALTEYMLRIEFEPFLEFLLENGGLSEQELETLDRIRRSGASAEDVRFVEEIAADPEKSLGHVYGHAYRLWDALLREDRHGISG